MYTALKERDIEKIIKHLERINCLVVETELNRRLQMKNKLILRNLIFKRSILPYGELGDDGEIINYGVLNLSSENPNKNYITIQFLELKDKEFVKSFISFAKEFCKTNNIGKVKLIISEGMLREKLTQVLEVVEENGFKKEVEYECMLGKQKLYALII